MNTDEKKESAKDSKFICFLRASYKTLIKARDFYIKSMTECSGKLDCPLALGCPVGQVSTILPISYCRSSPQSGRREEDYSELIRVASAPVKGTVGVSRSFSLAIGRIDEEKSC